MELPKGSMNGIAVSPEVKPKEIKCPVVETYKKRRGRTVERFKPDPRITNVTYDPKVKLEALQKQYVLMALERNGGSITKAAHALGIGKNTVYRYLGKFYGKQYETK